MAGKMRVAAKLFLGTTVLASGGGGAYYYTTHGLPLPGIAQQQKAPAASDLDAVASAWAEPSSTNSSDPSLSSPIARSAKPEVDLTAKKAEKSPAVDRYAAAIETPVKQEATPIAESPSEKPAASPTADTSDHKVAADDTTENDKSPAAAELEPTPAAEIQPIELASHTESASEDASASDAILARPETALARGQEPKDEPATKVSQSADIGAALNAAAGDGKEITEPRPLAAPAQPTNLGDGTRRAKQAFGNSSPLPPGDRYGGALPPPGEAQAPRNNAVTTNPFASKSAASAPIASKNETIQPLPSEPQDIGGRLSELEQGNSALRPLETGNSATPINSVAPLKAPIGPTARRDLIPSPDVTPLPAANSLDRMNEGAAAPLAAGDGSGKPGEKALEGPQQPTLVIQKFAPGEIQVGKPAKFVVQIRNAGAQSADNVTVRDEIPQGTKLVSTSPNATTEGNHIVWQIGKLSPGEDRNVEMQLMPTAEGEIGSIATVTYSAQASVKTKCTMPQLAIRMTANNEVMVGSQQHVKIEIRNPGSGDATGVMLFENVPANVKHVSGPALEFEIGTLRAGETRELDLVLSAEKAGKVLNQLTARADGNLQVQQQVEFEVIAPGLTVGLEGPERRYLERPATYEVSIENPGTAATHDIQIVTKLPKGMRFVRANNMGEYDAATHAVYWSLAELPKGERGTVELVAMPTETGPQTLQVEGRAQQGLTDHKQREILVEGLSALMFEVRDLEDPIEVGGETGYEIRVVNQGTKAATNVQVTVEIPAGMKVVSAEGESAHKIQEGRLIFEPIQQLAAKADTVYRVRAQGLQPGDQRVTVQVNTDDLEHPIRREESTRVFGDQ